MHQMPIFSPGLKIGPFMSIPPVPGQCVVHTRYFMPVEGKEGGRQAQRASSEPLLRSTEDSVSQGLSSEGFRVQDGHRSQPLTEGAAQPHPFHSTALPAAAPSLCPRLWPATCSAQLLLSPHPLPPCPECLGSASSPRLTPPRGN